VIFSIVLALYHIPILFFVVFIKDFQQILMSGFDTGENVFDFFGAHAVVMFLQFVTEFINCRFCIVHKFNDLHRFTVSSDGFSRPGIPIFWVHVGFHSEPRFFSVNGDPAKNRDVTVRFLFVPPKQGLKPVWVRIRAWYAEGAPRLYG
jgi:hypothetical protein